MSKTRSALLSSAAPYHLVTAEPARSSKRQGKRAADRARREEDEAQQGEVKRHSFNKEQLVQQEARREAERKARERYRIAAAEKLHNLQRELFLIRSLSIAEFLVVEGISRSAYYAMKKRGEGPDEVHVGARRLITPEARESWHLRHTVPASKAALASKPVPAVSQDEDESAL